MAALPNSQLHSETELRRLAAVLGGVPIAESAWDAARRIDPRSIAAITDAIAMAGVPVASQLAGFTSREDPSWTQLLIVIPAGDPGTPTWEASLHQASAVLAAAMDDHPELTSLPTEVVFAL